VTRLLILGESGQVGWELQRALAPLGQVMALGRTEADFEDSAKLREALDAAAPDIIVNASAYTAVEKAEDEPARADRINHLAVAELAQFARAMNAWVIQYSTDYVFDGRKCEPYLETDETNPLNVYGRTKRDGERAIVESGAKHLIFRTSWVYAARRNNFLRAILKKARGGEAPHVVADQYGAPTSADFIADATAHAIAAVLRGDVAASGTFNLASAGATTWYGFATLIVEEALALGDHLEITPKEIVAITTRDYPSRAVRPLNSRLNCHRLKDTFGIIQPDWQDGARRIVAESLALGR
jgi:dTDP-4-dehydrorhamnose reductase